MTDLWELLREARIWLHHGEDNCLNDHARWQHIDLLERIDAAFAEHKAKAEAELKTIAWLADIPAYADHLPMRVLVFDKRELESMQTNIRWTPLCEAP